MTSDNTAENGYTEMSLDEFTKEASEWAETAKTFVDGFLDSYWDSYNDALKEGKSPLEAKLRGLKSAISANQAYAASNAEKAAAAGDTLKGRVYQTLSDSYAAKEADLENQSFSTQAELDAYTDSMRQGAVDDLGKFAASEKPCADSALRES